MFHSLFSRFPQAKASVFTDVKELNEEHVYLFTMIPRTIIHLTVGNSKRHAFLMNISRPLNPIKHKSSPCIDIFALLGL